MAPEPFPGVEGLAASISSGTDPAVHRIIRRRNLHPDRIGYRWATLEDAGLNSTWSSLDDAGYACQVICSPIESLQLGKRTTFIKPDAVLARKKPDAPPFIPINSVRPEAMRTRIRLHHQAHAETPLHLWPIIQDLASDAPHAVIAWMLSPVTHTDEHLSEQIRLLQDGLRASTGMKPSILLLDIPRPASDILEGPAYPEAPRLHGWSVSPDHFRGRPRVTALHNWMLAHFNVRPAAMKPIARPGTAPQAGVDLLKKNSMLSWRDRVPARTAEEMQLHLNRAIGLHLLATREPGPAVAWLMNVIQSSHRGPDTPTILALDIALRKSKRTDTADQLIRNLLSRGTPNEHITGRILSHQLGKPKDQNNLQELLAEIRPQLPFINELLLLNDLRNLCPPRPKSPLNFGPRFSSAIKRLD